MTSTLRLTLVAVMLLAAAGIAMLYTRSAPVPAMIAQQIPQPLQVNYLTAARVLPAGTLTRDADFAQTAVSPTNLPDGALTDTPENRANLRGALVRRYMEAGATVRSDDILRPRDRGFLASVLPRNTRAYSIAVDAVSGVSGLIWPGDHVDVVLTHTMEHASPSYRNVGTIVATNVRVIAIDQEIVQGAPADNASAGKTVRTVTMQVDPEQVEKLAVAQTLGKLSLTIRPADEIGDDRKVGAIIAGDVSPFLAKGQAVRLITRDKSEVVTFGTGETHGE